MTPLRAPGSQFGTLDPRRLHVTPAGGETGIWRPRLVDPVVLDATFPDVYLANPTHTKPRVQ